jgi:hypothetical protein
MLPKYIGEYNMKLAEEVNGLLKKLFTETSHSDFLRNHEEHINKAYQKVKDIGRMYNNISDDTFNKVDKDLDKKYDKGTAEAIDSWASRPESTTKEDIIRHGMHIFGAHGTEPHMILHAIDDFHDIVKRNHKEK